MMEAIILQYKEVCSIVIYAVMGDKIYLKMQDFRLVLYEVA